jgi:S-adenosylmethionine decarboxylase
MKAEIYNVSGWINSVEELVIKKYFDELLEKSGFTILNYQYHQFKPVGYTGLWLLSESHFAVHTFPEESKAYIELSSCNYEFYESFKSECGVFWHCW